MTGRSPRNRITLKRVLRLRGEIEGRAFAAVLAQGPQRIGADPTCALVLVAAGVSRAHAAISAAGGRVTVEDLGSKNGTFVNGTRLDPSGELRPGGLLSLGAASLYLEEVDADDAELAIALTDSDPVSQPIGAMTTEPRAAALAAPHPWVEALAAIASIARPHRQDTLREALEALVAATGVTSAALLQLGSGGDPVVLASAGAPLREEVIAAATTACQAADHPAQAIPAAGIVGGSGRTVAWAGRHTEGGSW